MPYDKNGKYYRQPVYNKSFSSTSQAKNSSEKRKTAYRIITKKGGTGKPNNLEKIPPRGHTNYVDYSMWKRWLNTND